MFAITAMVGTRTSHHQGIATIRIKSGKELRAKRLGLSYRAGPSRTTGIQAHRGPLIGLAGEIDSGIGLLASVLIRAFSRDIAIDGEGSPNQRADPAAEQENSSDAQ
jgi:hypothetical protein